MMGSGERAERIALGETRGQAVAIQEHQLAMIPIMQQQAEMQLEMRGEAFEQELGQAKEINLLAQQLQPEPVLVPAGAVAKPASKYLIYAGLAALAYFFLR